MDGRLKDILCKLNLNQDKNSQVTFVEGEILFTEQGKLDSLAVTILGSLISEISNKFDIMLFIEKVAMSEIVTIEDLNNYFIANV